MYSDELTNAQFRNIGNQVDVLTQNSLKNIPRSRLVLLNGVPFDAHSLHTYFSSGTQKHPIYPKKTIPKNVTNKIRNKAISTDWKPQKNTQNSRVPNHLKNFAAKQANGIRQGRKRQRQQQAVHILGNSRQAIRKVENIAEHIQKQNSMSQRIAVPQQGFTMVRDMVGNKVTGLRLLWGAQTRATLYPLVQTNFGLLPRPVAPNRLEQAFWVMEAPVDTVVPGTTKTVRQMTEALAALLGLVIEQSVQQHELIEDIRTAIEYAAEDTVGKSFIVRLKAVLQAIRSLDRRCARGGDCGISIVKNSFENGRLVLVTDPYMRNINNINNQVKNIAPNGNASSGSVVFDVVPLDLFVVVFVSRESIRMEVLQAA